VIREQTGSFAIALTPVMALQIVGILLLVSGRRSAAARHA
jgi:MFS transporter, ACS family, tartrate transporter